jgi:putative flippase GtrA
MLTRAIVLVKLLTFNCKKVFFFLLFGIVTLFIYYAILGIFFSFLGLQYREAVTIAYSASIIFHFLTNRKFTFNSGEKIIRNQILRYLLIALLNYIIQLGAIILFYEMFGVNFYLSTLFGIMLTMVTGYLLMNSWVFKSTDSNSKRNALD